MSFRYLLGSLMLSIRTLIHHADFDLETAALGVIRCGPNGKGGLRKFDAAARIENRDGVALARSILLEIGHHKTGDEEADKICAGRPLTQEEIEKVSRRELDEFCDRFAAKRLRSLVTEQGESEPTPQIPSRGCESIAVLIVNRNDAEVEASRKILEQALKPPAWRGSDRELIGGRLPTFMPLHIPRNPVIDTNEILTSQLEHLRSEAVRAAADGANAARIARDSLSATRNGLWVAVLALVVTIVFASISLLDEKENAANASKHAAENAAKAARENAALREQVRLLVQAATDAKTALIPPAATTAEPKK